MTAEYYKLGAPTLFTADEAAGILRVKKSWLERQAAARKVPFTVLGGSYRFTSAHLEEIVRLYERSPAPQVECTGRGSRTRRQNTHAREGATQVFPLRPRPQHGPPRQA